MNGGLWQRGQSMVEYAVVVVALVSSLLLANQGCSGSHDNCVAWLLDTLDNNYQGYSRALTAVQRYGDQPLRDGQTIDPPHYGNEEGGGGAPPGTGLDPDGLTEAKLLQDHAGTIGRLYADNSVVGPDGGVIGTYDPNTGVFTYTAGSSAGQTVANAYAASVVLDEEGNALTMQAVVDSNGEVLGFGYKSMASGKFFRAFDYGLMPLQPDHQVVPSRGVVDGSGEPLGGRIVGSAYYANTFTITLGVQTPVGEVVFVPPSQCAVVGVGWDEGVDTELDEQALYDARMAALEDALIGYKDPVAVAAEGCRAARQLPPPA